MVGIRQLLHPLKPHPLLKHRLFDYTAHIICRLPVLIQQNLLGPVDLHHARLDYHDLGIWLIYLLVGTINQCESLDRRFDVCKGGIALEAKSFVGIKMGRLY